MTDRPRLELAEYQQQNRLCSPPREQDRRLAQQLSAGTSGPRLEVRWLDNGTVDVTASAWVGVVRFSDLDVHITPKYVGGNLSLLMMLDYIHGTGFLRELDNRRTLHADGDHLHELLCRMLANQANQLLRDGLARTYRSVNDELAVLRGRLDHRTQILRRFGQLDRLHCSSDEHDTDNPENQLICVALGVARSLISAGPLRSTIGKLHTVFAEVCAPTTRDPDWYRSRITYGRLNERYRTGHGLAYLLLDHIGFDDLYNTQSKVEVHSFLLNMNSVFEEFITTLLADALHGSGHRVAPKQRHHSMIFEADSGRPYASIIPDLTIETRLDNSIMEQRVPVDVKYKLYDDRQITTGDIYQAFTYALALSSGSTNAAAGVIYPGRQTKVTTRLDIAPHAAPTRARITIASVDLATILDQIRSNGTLPEPTVRQLRTIAQSILGVTSNEWN